MRVDKNDTRGRIPPEQLKIIHGGNNAGKTLEQNWQLTEAMIYNAMWTMREAHEDQPEHLQAVLRDITPIEKTAMYLYGHWMVYGWDVAKAMIREIYPGIVNNHISITISGIGDA